MASNWRFLAILATVSYAVAGYAQTKFEHDALNRLSSATLSNGSTVTVLYDASGNITQTVKILRNIKTSLDDPFDGMTLDQEFWTPHSYNGYPLNVEVSGGQVKFGNCNNAETREKVELSGSRIVITARFSGPGTDRNSDLTLVDADSGYAIQSGDSSYSGYGLYLILTGQQPVYDGGSTPSFMEYRLTLQGSNVLLERGTTLDAVSQSLTATLPDPIDGRRFFVEIGTSCGAFQPALFDWVRAGAR